MSTLSGGQPAAIGTVFGPEALVLGIESSCDDMAAAVLRDGQEILSNSVRGQAHVHAPYGGVVPELASRDHVTVVSEVVDSALREAGLEVGDLDDPDVFEYTVESSVEFDADLVRLVAADEFAREVEVQVGVSRDA